MMGYIGGAVDSTPIEDGWLHTGDLGSVDCDGYLTVSGRLKDTIIRGGENLSPAVIERALAHHPAVQDCCVVGRSHPDLGETPVAFVSLSSREHIDAAGLYAWVEPSLPRPYLPDEIVVLEELPVTAIGKVDRSRLKVLASQ